MSITVREARSIIRKAKRQVPEHEAISHLNLTAMMDMMTILLVFMIKSMATQTSSMTMGSVAPPNSSTRLPPPEETVAVIIARDAIIVNGVVGSKPVVKVVNGDVDPSEKTQGKFGLEIAKVKLHLEKERTGAKKRAEMEGLPPPPDELMIIADKDTPYRLLTNVLLSAAHADYGQYRLIVLRNEE
jgi:biopolymer transport protein ExbD